MSSVYPMPLQRRTQRILGRVTGRRLRHDNQVHSGQCVLRLPKTFPDTAFDAVAHHRLGGDAARDRYAETRVPQTIGTCMHTEQIIANASTLAGDFAQLASGTQSPALG